MKDDIILDFFSGSATTAHAVMQLNAEDGGNRKFIMVQCPENEPGYEKSEAFKEGYKNICEIGKERIRRAGKKIIEETGKTDLEKNKVEKCINALIETIEEAVSDGDTVQLVGFGTFERRKREARMGRNPQTGEELKIPASNIPAFKAGKIFKDLVNGIRGK